MGNCNYISTVQDRKNTRKRKLSTPFKIIIYHIDTKISLKVCTYKNPQNFKIY